MRAFKVTFHVASTTMKDQEWCYVFKAKTYDNLQVELKKFYKLRIKVDGYKYIYTPIKVKDMGHIVNEN